MHTTNPDRTDEGGRGSRLRTKLARPLRLSVTLGRSLRRICRGVHRNRHIAARSGSLRRFDFVHPI